MLPLRGVYRVCGIFCWVATVWAVPLAEFGQMLAFIARHSRELAFGLITWSTPITLPYAVREVVHAAAGAIRANDWRHAPLPPPVDEALAYPDSSDFGWIAIVDGMTAWRPWEYHETILPPMLSIQCWEWTTWGVCAPSADAAVGLCRVTT